MSTVIRMPEAATPLLPFCEKHKINLRDDHFFPTFAHMIMFSASIGYKRDEFDEHIEFCKKEPYPIPIETFISLGLFEQIIVLGLARTKSYEVVKDYQTLSQITEGYSSAGFREMLRIFEKSSGHNYLDFWIQDIVNIG